MTSKNAFSLVELAIVLAILGLLTGAVLTGQSLIRAAELRAFLTEAETYRSSVKLFHKKYLALPGDMADATELWGRADNGSFSGDCANNVTDVGTGLQTCNGNGDGKISPILIGDFWEYFRFWEHLQAAGLISGEYSGVHGPSGPSDHIFGENSPISRLTDAGWGVEHSASFPGSDAAYAIDYQHLLIAGAYAGDSIPDGAVMTPEEAWSIDTKLDDGLPAYGNVIARFWNDACAAADNGVHSNTNFEAHYKVSDNTIQCALYFRKIF